MTKFDRIDIQRLAVSAIGALIVSTACVAAATTPLHAAEITNTPLTINDWQKSVEHQIDRNLRSPAGLNDGVMRKVHVAIRFDEQGKIAGARVVRSSGLATADAEALRVANKIAYPALPAGLRGHAQTIGMNLLFATPSSEQALQEVLAAQRNGVGRPMDAVRQADRTAALPSG
jgi:TonB family protein